MAVDSRAIVVTGCTQGLGYHAVKTLAQNLAADSKSLPFQCIILSCRNVPVAKKAAEEISKSTKCELSRLVVLDEPCNLSDIISVRSYCSSLIKYLSGRKILSLVNNAGIGGNPVYTKTAQGYDQIWATNHLGHFLLTLLLLPHMAEGSRIVNVSSEVHDPASKTGLPDADQFWPQVSIPKIKMPD
jgi:retinol dehydrogenase 12